VESNTPGELVYSYVCRRGAGGLSGYCFFVFSELAAINISAAIVVFFLGAMLLLIMGLILFLIEVSISTRSIGTGITEILDEDKPA